jgi:threonine dehydrogenase-like Zn-dependent dehydrogenase
MRAARIRGPGRVEIEDAPMPEPGHGQVRFRVEGSGVCASNLGPWKGLPWLKYPLGPGEGGHEAWGVVDAVGRSVSRLRPGDRIAALSGHAYADYDVTDEASAMLLPRELEGLDFPAEALACAFNVFRRADVRAGQVVAIVGIGFLGAILTKLCSAACARVIALSRRESSLDVARALGAMEVMPMQHPEASVSRVEVITRREMCDTVIEVVGTQQALDLSAKLVKTRGHLVIAGYHQDGPRTVDMQSWNWRGIDVSNAHERDPEVYMNGMRAAVHAVVSGSLPLSPLLTHRYSLEELGTALDATRDKPQGFVKAVVCP